MSSNTSNTHPQGLVRALDVLAVIRAPLEQYPPSLHQVSLLAEAGLTVGVVEASHPDFAPQPFKGDFRLERFQPCRHTLLYKEPVPHWLPRIWRIFKFGATVRRVVRRRRPRVVIAYDPPAMQMAGSLWKQRAGPRLIWHFHELFEPTAPGGAMGRLATSFSCRNASKAALITFPDHGRAELFARQAGLDAKPMVVRNCPRRLDSLPENRLQARLSGLGFPAAKAVYFQGWMGPSRCLETLIQSMKFWPADSVLVLTGPISEAYKGALRKLAQDLGLLNRLVFMGHVPYQSLWSLAVGAAVGVSLVAGDKDPNWLHSAGAINKRFEYMAVGLPQVANAGPGMEEIIEKPDCGLLVNPASAQETGRAITRLLEDPSLRRRLAENARSAHLREFNYESQFAPVLEKILGWCRNQPAVGVPGVTNSPPG